MHIEIVDYDPSWPARFATVGAALRAALGPVAVRIDHIGSTSVPGLAAKPVVDIQVSVDRLEPDASFREPLQELGLVFRAENPDRTKRYFRERPGDRRTHIHVRRAGSFAEQFALLFRDFLRADAATAAEYAALKRALAVDFREDRHGYTDAKSPFFWETIRRAADWTQETGWEPGPSDC
ncbi:GrpB family protein [Actinoplanes sp. NPDC023714]|uniref:GrpB family protein n=1 Tax=Actinoplanes sp. NPDC023714 TaxID=3154322 RepID=UPI0033F2B8F2